MTDPGEALFIRLLRKNPPPTDIGPERLVDMMAVSVCMDPGTIAKAPARCGLLLHFINNHRDRAIQLIAGAQGYV